MIKSWSFKSESELPLIASEFIQAFPDLKKVALYGKMGVGKTTFIKAICQKLDANDQVSSPTFSIINEYFSNKCGSIYHFDFYRLEEEQEVYDMGYEEYFYSDSYCFVEWPERIASLLSADFANLYMEEKDGNRIIKIEIYD